MTDLPLPFGRTIGKPAPVVACDRSGILQPVHGAAFSPDRLRFSCSAEPLLTLHADGRIEFGPMFERNEDAAVQRFVDLVHQQGDRYGVPSAKIAAERYAEALTPSASTKAAYSGEIYLWVEDRDEDGEECPRKVLLPWDTIKEVMKLASDRAAEARP